MTARVFWGEISVAGLGESRGKWTSVLAVTLMSLSVCNLFTKCFTDALDTIECPDRPIRREEPL